MVRNISYSYPLATIFLYRIYTEVHLSNCPLKELPQKQEDLPTNIYREGWNACIDNILRGSVENE